MGYEIRMRAMWTAVVLTAHNVQMVYAVISIKTVYLISVSSTPVSPRAVMTAFKDWEKVILIVGD